MEVKKISAIERFKTALRHKEEVKQNIIKEYAAKGQTPILHIKSLNRVVPCSSRQSKA